MTKKKAQDSAAGLAADAGVAETAAEVAAEEATDALASAEDGTELEDGAALLEAAKAEAASLKDAALRAQAEVENIRRRAARDVENAHKFALERFAEGLLPVVDGLEKSAQSAAAAEDIKAVAQGVELLLKLFIDTLKKHGIEQLDPLGAPFDPSQSEAMAMVENPNAEHNSVMEVMQKGYLLNGRLVRAAKVIVAKAPGS